LQFNQGEAMILLATWFWAVENILAKKALKTVSSEIVGFFRMGVGGLLLFLTTIFFGQIKIIFSLTFSQWQLILPGVALLFFYVFFWYKALKYAPASLVTLILTFSMVVGNILNGAFAGVRISQNEIYSSSLILIAASLIFLHTVYQRKSLNKLNG
jgi:drug/metabolite transporter (DMT)-like permease